MNSTYIPSYKLGDVTSEYIEAWQGLCSELLA